MSADSRRMARRKHLKDNDMKLRGFIVLVLSVLMTACVSVQYDPYTPSYFTGSVLVIWVGETEGSSGDGKFLFIPNPNDLLTFHRSATDTRGRVIEPGLMYTDGGSIPKIAQVFNGLSPWGYAPAYMIHDWLFTAHHCLVDGRTDKKYDQVRDIDFDESARVLNEAISALINQRIVKHDDLAVGAITGAVDSFVAQNLWDARGACEGLKVSDADLAAARKVIPGISAFRRFKSAAAALDRELQAAVDATRGTRLPPARLVTEVSIQR
jgi:hypothetical protein